MATSIDFVVTRHAGLVDYLIAEGLAPAGVEVVSHVSDPSVLDGKHVCGVLPVGLAARCASFTEVQLNLPAEMRGKELSEAQVREYATGVQTFVVRTKAQYAEDMYQARLMGL